MISAIHLLLAAATVSTANADDLNTQWTASSAALVIIGLCIVAYYLCKRHCACQDSDDGFRTFENDDHRPRNNSRRRRFFRRFRRKSNGPNYPPHQTHVIIQPIVQVPTETRCPMPTAGSAYNLNQGGHSNPSFEAGSTYIPHMQPAPPPYEKY